MKLSYLVRYGIMSQIARMNPERDGETYERGQNVILRTERGLEIGEVLGAPRPPEEGFSPYAIVRGLREDERRSNEDTEAPRTRLLEVCDEVFRQGTWPIDLIDVEVLSNLGQQEPSAVIHYLGPHGLDTEGLAEALRERTGFSLQFQAAGIDAEDVEEAEDVCSRCGSAGGGGCGSGGGESHSGCSSCALSALPRRRAATAAD
jgi:hypothetical protein